MIITEFTDKELTALAGWKAWKEGKGVEQTFESLQIKDYLVSGVLKVGRKKTRSVVKLVEGELVPSCSCSQYEQSYGFCLHTVALLLQSREVKQLSSNQPSQEAGVEFVSTPLRLTVHLGQPLVDCIELRQISLKVSVTEAPYQAHPSSVFLALGVKEEVGESLIQIPGTSLAELLRLNAQSMFLEVKGGSLIGSTSATRFPLVLQAREDERLDLKVAAMEQWQMYRIPAHILLYNPRSGGYNIQPEPAQSRGNVVKLLEERTLSISLRGFLNDSEAFASWFDLQDVEQQVVALFTPVSPQFKLHLEGTVQRVHATLAAVYGEIQREVSILGANGFDLLERSLDGFSTSDVQQEQSALRLLAEAGFEPKSSGQLILTGEGEIQEFVAYTMPRITERKWDLTIMGSFRAFYHNTIPLVLTAKLDPFAQDDRWVSLTYAFQTPQGQGMKAGEVQRLMQTGRQSFKTKQGKIALISRKEYELITESLLDCSSRQVAGKYTILKEDLDQLINVGIKGLLTISSQGLRSNLSSLIPDDLSSKLRSYQMDGVRWLIETITSRKCALLADDMGLGKTIQAISVVSHLRSLQNSSFLVVCPASLVTNWREEFAKWLPEMEVEIAGGVMGTSSATVIITSYQRYYSDAERHQEVDYTLCILDEASYIKNSQAKISKTLKRQPASYKLALTGTPLENSAEDLWSIFQFLNPSHLPSQKVFQERFLKPLKSKGYSAQLATKRLRAKLSSVVLRRTKSEVLTELPPKTYRIEYCPCSQTQREQINAIKQEYRDLQQQDSSERQNTLQILTSILRLRQVANDLSLIDDTATEPSPKTKRLLEILQQAQQLGQKVLVFSQFAKMLQILEIQISNAGYNCSMLTGATQDRDKEINKFKDPDGSQVFLISLKAGGYGLNLTEANIVVHYDPWWNPAVENQATDRAYRMGQSDPVTVFKLATQDSIDERIIALQKNKQDLFNLTVDDKNPNFTSLDRVELRRLID